MAYEKKEYKPYPDGGSLRANTTKKTQNSKDYWGEIAINMKDMTNIKVVDGLHLVKISGWKKTDKQGKTYLSLSVDRYVPENKGAQSHRQEDDLDGDIPF